MRHGAGVLIVGALLSCGVAAASTGVAVGVQRPALRVDARGNAEISWTQSGTRRTLLVPPTGRVLPGGRLSGRDVSRSASSPAIPFRRVLRRTPDGRLWALQDWTVLPGRRELRFARWRGAPMKITLTTRPRFDGELVEGRATFAGSAVTGYSLTPAGKRVRVFAYVDAARGGSWQRVGGVAPRSDGSFRLYLAPAKLGPRYRVTVVGPNRGATFVPDGSAVVASSIR